MTVFLIHFKIMTINFKQVMAIEIIQGHFCLYRLDRRSYLNVLFMFRSETWSMSEGFFVQTAATATIFNMNP